MATALPLESDSSASAADVAVKGANCSLALLLAINLFNYVDRQVFAAVELAIEKDPDFHGISQTKIGFAGTVFLLSYMVIAPAFGVLADRMSRWLLVGIGVILWSLASGGTGLAKSYGLLVLMRACVGIGEGAYGPVAPTILSDLYPASRRGRVLSWFYLALPVGSALGYVFGGQIVEQFHDWRIAFYLVVPPGILLGAWALFMNDPRRGGADATATPRRAAFRDYVVLARTKSYVLNTMGMAAMTFAIGGIGFWMPRYVVEYRRHGTLAQANMALGGITVVSGFLATLAGGWAGDRLRKKYSGSYFIVSGIAMLLGFPLLLAVLHAPFPLAWGFIFLAVFCLFFNTGPTNAILANVTHPSMRATGFAINIFLIHLFGDAAAWPIIGWMSERRGMNFAFTVVSVLVLVGGVLWLWGARYLREDTERAPTRLATVTS